MSILKGKLIVDDIAFTILRCNYAFYKHIDERGQPYQGHNNKALRFTLEARKEATLFFDWIKHPTMMKHCRAEFASIHGTTKGHKIELYDAHCVAYGREFNHQGSTPFLVYVTLTAATIVINGQEAIAHPWAVTPPKTMSTSVLVREEVITEAIKVTHVDGPFDEAGNKIQYISPKHEYYYHATVKNYEEGDDLNQIVWSATYDGEDSTKHQKLTTGGIYEDGVVKKAINVSKGKQKATIYAYTETPNSNIATTATYKQVVTFFIGGAGDKEPFYNDWKTEIMKGVEDAFKDKIRYEQYSSYYLGYNEVKGNKDIEKYVLDVIPNKDGVKINIVGHSLGGWNGAHLSDILTTKGYIVDTLITLDPVGEGGGVTLISDIHLLFPNPKADYWINIYTDPKNYKQDDFIADLGGQWFPRKQKPHITHITNCSHGEAKKMFNEIIAKKTIAPSSLLLTSIHQYLENK